MLKLNLGSHDRQIPGYDNVDKDDYPGVKYKADVSKLEQFEDNSVDVVRASHILEHFAPKCTTEILKEWHRVLKTDGLLYLSVPDWERIITAYAIHGLCDWVITSLYGDQGYDGAEHKTVFDERRLRDYLGKAGFTDISRVEILPDTPIGECSMNKANWDGKFVSLNMIAIKV